MHTTDGLRITASRKPTASRPCRCLRSSTAPEANGPRRIPVSGASASHQIDRFLDHLTAERGLSPNTLAAYRRDLRRYAAFLDDREVRDAAASTEDDVAAFVAHLSSSRYGDGKSYRTSSVARAIAAVRSFHRFLVMEGDVGDDAAAGVVRPRVPRTLPHPLSVDEVRRILDSPAGGTALALR